MNMKAHFSVHHKLKIPALRAENIRMYLRAVGSLLSPGNAIPNGRELMSRRAKRPLLTVSLVLRTPRSGYHNLWNN